MLVSYKWLKELVDVDVTTHELSEKMSTTGIEVEGVSSPSDGLTKLVVGYVVSCEDVPDTHLHLCQVDTGDDELRQIVCGGMGSSMPSFYQFPPFVMPVLTTSVMLV